MSDGINDRSSNFWQEVEEYQDRCERMFGDQLEPRACSGCGAEWLPERLNRAGQCTKCGPADPKPTYETADDVLARMRAESERKTAARIRRPIRVLKPSVKQTAKTLQWVPVLREVA